MGKKHCLFRGTIGFAAAASLMIATGCKDGKDLNSPGLTGTPSVDNSPSPDPSPSLAPGVNDSAGLSVTLVPNPKYTYKIHEGTGALSGDATPDDFTKACTILPTSTNKDISCIVEAQELDLWFHGISINFNVPSNFCSYFGVQKPFYWNFKGDVGPAVVLVNEGTGAYTDPSTGVSVAVGQTKIDGTLATSDGIGGVGTASGGYSSEPYCRWDYSTSKNPDRPNANGGGPNCCSGSYRLVKVTQAATTGDPDVVSESTADWGGKATNCLAGAAIDNGEALSTGGLPLGELHYVEGTGLNSSYSVSAPISKLRSSNVSIANFFKLADHGGALPLAYQAISGKTPNPYHQFTCYDRSAEVQARIRIMIRDWNLASEYALGVSGNPDSTGNESNFDNPPKNDAWDFNDFENYSGSLVPAYPKETSY